MFKQWLTTACMVGLLLYAVGLYAAALSFSKVTITLGEDERIFIDAQLQYALSQVAEEALENGVPLTFEMHIQMRADSAWVWEPDVTEYRIRNTLRYRPLSTLYEVSTQGIEGKQVFATRSAALRYMGSIRNFALVGRDKLDLDKQYLVRLNAYLDIDALPLPLRTQAYFSEAWSLQAEPWEWLLKP
jgi:hypothetical protein